MKIAFPAVQDAGLGTQVHDHFGTARFFIIADSETGECKLIENRDMHHKHGECQPGKSLGSEKVDAVIAGGIGKGALSKLSSAGIAIYRGIEGTVSENLSLFKTGKLPVFPVEHACTDHNHEHHCC